MILHALTQYYQRKAESDDGVAPEGFENKEIPFIIVIDKQGKFISGTIIPITQAGDKTPKIDPKKTVIERIIYLNHSDFPNGNGLDVSPDGSITRR